MAGQQYEVRRRASQKIAGQVAAGFFSFLSLPDFVLAGLRAVAGLMLIGAPVVATAASSGPGLK
jgi:hypothetical protein